MSVLCFRPGTDAAVHFLMERTLGCILVVRRPLLPLFLLLFESFTTALDSIDKIPKHKGFLPSGFA